MDGVTESLIFIDKSTSFNGSIEAKQVVVEGNVEGDITASDKVLVKNGGLVNGSIITDKFLLEEGGRHNGTIQLEYSITEEMVTKRKSERSSVTKSIEQKNQDGNVLKNKSSEKETPKRLW